MDKESSNQSENHDRTPIQWAPDFQDWTLEHTYMSSQGKPLCLARTQRVRGHMPTVEFYLPDRVEAGKESVFVRGFGATSPDRTDGSWIVTLSQPEGAYMAVAVVQTAFLFDNLDRCCIHAAAGFGDIGPGQTGTTVSRFYLAKGTLEDFLKRYAADLPGLASRQKAVSLSSARSQRSAAARESRDSRRHIDTLRRHALPQIPLAPVGEWSRRFNCQEPAWPRVCCLAARGWRGPLGPAGLGPVPPSGALFVQPLAVCRHSLQYTAQVRDGWRMLA